MSSNQTEAPLRCDICLMKDGWKGLEIQQCRKCGVAVHQGCYCMATEANSKSFVCWACQSVGKTIPAITQHGKVKRIVQEKRPMECTLCAVSGGTHAMHALYRDHGPDGKQLVLPAGRNLPERLAWVHSLCALTVCSHRGTRGCVYGCNEAGIYDDDEDDLVHHFVMCGSDPENDQQWINMLKEHRELTCTICGDKDKSAGKNLRVPLQCCAGDGDEEYEEFKQYHKSVLEPCMQAMHVGCAQWGTRGHPPRIRHMWFFPGIEDGEYQEPVTQIFCDYHAKMMDPGIHGLKGAAPKPEPASGLLCYAEDEKKKPSPTDVLPSYTSPSVQRRASGSTHPTSRKHKPEAPSELHAVAKKRGSRILATAKDVSSRRLGDVMKERHAIPRKTAPTHMQKDDATTPQTLNSGESSILEKQAQLSPPSTAGRAVDATSNQSGNAQHVASTKESSTSLPFKTPPKPKRRRVRSISEEKRSEPNDDDAMSTDSSSSDDDLFQDNDGWMSDSAQGMVQTDELPAVTEPPEGGNNPWSYLWKEDAPPFKLEIVSSEKRRSTGDKES